MPLNEIKTATKQGLIVCWVNDSYEVKRTPSGGYYICFLPSGNSIGLTWSDGETLNGEEEEFYIKGK